MAIGFIKDVGGAIRMRLAKPGYDADNLATPYNRMVFDSAVLGSARIWAAGTWSGTLTTTLTKVVAWASPGYIPAVVLQSNCGTEIYQWFIDSLVTIEIWAAADGIYVKRAAGTQSVVMPYIAYRMAAA